MHHLKCSFANIFWVQANGAPLRLTPIYSGAFGNLARLFLKNIPPPPIKRVTPLPWVMQESRDYDHLLSYIYVLAPIVYDPYVLYGHLHI